MPELCEVVFTAQYLLTKLKNRLITSIEVVSGRYTHEKLIGLDNLVYPLKILNIDSKGKFLWFELEHKNKKYYAMNTFGLTGHWGFHEENNIRIKITINSDIEKEHTLYYTDPRNFGTLKITSNYSDLKDKLDSLGMDLLKTEFTEQQFIKIINDLNKTKRKDKKIIEILMAQEKNKGIGSGLGNYLGPEILYRTKLSPHRKMISLTETEIKNLYDSIKYVVKLCYVNNKIGYMEMFKSYVDKHKEGVESGKYPNYHPDVNIGNDEFKFNVYQQEKDPLGNEVKKSSIVGERTTYWVPSVQV